MTHALKHQLSVSPDSLSDSWQDTEPVNFPPDNGIPSAGHPVSLVLEKPLALEIQVNTTSKEGCKNQKDIIITGTDRTPGSPESDIDLVVGFCRTGGLIHDRDDIISVEDSGNRQGTDCIRIHLHRATPLFADRLETGLPPLLPDSLASSVESGKAPALRPVSSLPAESLRERLMNLGEYQPLRGRTKATHGAVILDADLSAMIFAEDVGRHNALDKAVGRLIRQDCLEKAAALLLSSRVSLEMFRKALYAGFTIILSVSRPTAEAVDAARRFGVTLGCLSPGDGLWIFSGPDRLLNRTQEAYSEKVCTGQMHEHGSDI